MLTELCQYLHNWFDRKPNGEKHPKYDGEFNISGNHITELEDQLVTGQYIRVIGSLFNDGVYKYGVDTLTDEVFSGVVWSMSIPPDVVALADDISAWRAKYETADSTLLSPFTSESFGGYSYSKAAGASAAGAASANGWQSVFANRLNPWRKI